MAHIHVYQNRGITKIIQINDANGDAISPDESDKIRAVIGRIGNIESDLSGAALVITSDADTANGSSFTKRSPTSTTNTLRLDAQDLADISPGVYDLLIDYFDFADASDWKNADRHILVIERE